MAIFDSSCTEPLGFIMAADGEPQDSKLFLRNKQSMICYRNFQPSLKAVSLLLSFKGCQFVPCLSHINRIHISPSITVFHFSIVITSTSKSSQYVITFIFYDQNLMNVSILTIRADKPLFSHFTWFGYLNKIQRPVGLTNTILANVQSLFSSNFRYNHQSSVLKHNQSLFSFLYDKA